MARLNAQQLRIIWGALLAATIDAEPGKRISQADVGKLLYNGFDKRQLNEILDILDQVEREVLHHGQCQIDIVA